MDNPRFVTLRYRIKNDYTAQYILEHGFDVGEYTTVLSMPLREMISTTPEKMADELIRYMTEAGKARAVDAGDVFYMNNEGWMYIRQADGTVFKDAATANIQGDNEKKLLLVKLDLNATQT